MIEDHTKAGEEFKAVLKEANIDPPSDMLDTTHMAKYAKLRVFTTEKSFEPAYVTEQVKAHEEAVATFKDYAQNGGTPPLKAFAEKTLPILEHHLTMAKDLNAKVPKS
jgi:putative membrane protein